MMEYLLEYVKDYGTGKLEKNLFDKLHDIVHAVNRFHVYISQLTW
jgi:hypothetical protein